MKGSLASVALVLALASGAPAQTDARREASAPTSVAGWVDLLRSRRQADQDRAVAALLREGRRVEQSLLAVLEEPQLPPGTAARALGLLYAIEAPSALDALLRASTHRDAERRNAAAEYLTNFKTDARARQALVTLVGDGDPQVALNAVASARGIDDAWAPLLERVVVPGLRDASESSVVNEGISSLRFILVKHASVERIAGLLRECAALEDPAAQLRLLSVITENQVPVAAPFLRWILIGPATDEELEAAPSEEADSLQRADELFAEEDLAIFAAVDGVRAAAMRGFARAGTSDAPAVGRRLLRDRDPRVRAAALSTLAVPAEPFSLEREQTLEALVVLLTDPDRDIRKTAHKLLTITTKQTLPLSAPRWVEWLQAERPRMQRGRELEALARENGYESVEAFVRDYPEFAPPPEQDQAEEEQE